MVPLRSATGRHGSDNGRYIRSVRARNSRSCQGVRSTRGGRVGSVRAARRILYVLLGPNGAGKTTTLRMATGLLKPDRGSIAVFGIDALADPIGAKRIMAWLSDEPMIYDELTPIEYLDFVAGLWGVERDAAAARAQRLARLPRPRSACRGALRGLVEGHASEGGVGRRAGARAAADHPGRAVHRARCRLGAMVKDVLRERVDAGCSVIMTTHILEVAERMADRIGVMSARQAHRRRHARTNCGIRRAPATPASRTPSWLWSRPTRAPGSSRHERGPARSAWFARHETRLAWRDWAWLLSGGHAGAGYAARWASRRSSSSHAWARLRWRCRVRSI